MVKLRAAPKTSQKTLIYQNNNSDQSDERSKKRARLEAAATSPAQDLMVEVERFASILSTTLEL